MAKIFLKSGYLTQAGRDTVFTLLNADEEKPAPVVWGKPLPPDWDAVWVRFHGVRQLGRGRFVTLSYSYDAQARELLSALNVPFTEGNDAIRGGKTGAYLRFDLRAFKEALVRSIKIA